MTLRVTVSMEPETKKMLEDIAKEEREYRLRRDQSIGYSKHGSSVIMYVTTI